MATEAWARGKNVPIFLALSFTEAQRKTFQFFLKLQLSAFVDDCVEGPLLPPHPVIMSGS